MKLGWLVIEASHSMRGMLFFQNGMTQGLIRGEHNHDGMEPLGEW